MSDMSVASRPMTKQDTPLMDRTYRVSLPSGELAEVPCLELNMARFADLDGGNDGHIQLTNGAWIRHRVLTVIQRNLRA